MDSADGQPVVARDPDPLEDVVDQDQAAVPQEDVPADLVNEVQADPDNRSCEQPDAGQGSVALEQPVQDIP